MRLLLLPQRFVVSSTERSPNSYFLFFLQEPTPELLRRKPYSRGEALISKVMMRNILGLFFDLKAEANLTLFRTMHLSACGGFLFNILR